MKSFFCFIFLVCLVFGFSQAYSRQEKTFLSQVSKLDSLMENNNSKILELFSDDVSFGHSNGWIQNYEDFKTDFESGKVKYQSVKQTELKEFKFKNKFANIRRNIAVKGLYKNETFEMNLSLLEIWIKNKSDWKLWSRQSMEIK